MFKVNVGLQFPRGRRWCVQGGGLIFVWSFSACGLTPEVLVKAETGCVMMMRDFNVCVTPYFKVTTEELVRRNATRHATVTYIVGRHKI